MKRNIDSSMDEYYESLCDYVVELSVNQDYGYAAIRQALMNEGLSKEEAEMIIEKSESKLKVAKRKKGYKLILFGFLWIAVGVLLTCLFSGMVIFYGAILCGMSLCIIGVVKRFGD